MKGLLEMYAVIGANGQVGQEFARALGPGRGLFLTHKDIDVTDTASIEAALGASSCSAIINLAAFHNVNVCESEAEEAFRVNAVGAANVAKVAKGIGCRVVYLSSDYVFGQHTARRTPYRESDPPAPLNVYGTSKAAGEQLVRAISANHLIIRTSSVFGAMTSRKGWTFPEMILRRARDNESLRVVNDQFMSPTYSPDLAGCVLQLLKMGVTGTLHVSNTGICSWYEFARLTLRLAGINREPEPVPSAAFPSLAPRPLFSALSSERFALCGIAPMRSWQEALQAYLIETGFTRRSQVSDSRGASMPGEPQLLS